MAIEGLLGKKLGMMQRFAETGEVEGVTVLEAGPCRVVQVLAQMDATDVGKALTVV